MSLSKYIITTLLLFGVLTKGSSETFDEKCYLTTKSKGEKESIQSYQFDQTILECSSDISILKDNTKLYLKKDLKLIRAHGEELNSLTILASSHGYHLIDQDLNCDQVHCDHVSLIELDEFNNIHKFDQQDQPLKGSNMIQSLVDAVDSSLWLADVVTLSTWSRKSGSNGNHSAATWIQGQLNNLNFDVSLQGFSVSGSFTSNIIGIQTGSTKPDDWYIIGAHMDSIPSNGSAPGAVDNASGCAGVLEMARIASDYSFASTIIFICYSGEEQGLIGSSYHVDSILLGGNQSKVKAALTMDMIGYTSNTDHELLLETSSSNQWLMDLLAQNAATYAPSLTVYTSTNPFGSDHVPYINNNMHGILSIDDDWNVYPDYHKSTDLPENINLIQGELILKVNMASLAQLAEVLANNDVIFQNGFD